MFFFLGALLLLIDECKILIHSATLVRQYVKLMITDTFGMDIFIFPYNNSFFLI
jgi:hypothetical protein